MTNTYSGGDASGLQQTGDLLTRARGGDPEAWEELLRRYRQPLERFLHGRLPARSRALLETQDLLQEVCVRAFQSLARFEYRGAGSFWAYLRTIGANYLRSLYRKAGARPKEQGLPEESWQAPSDEEPSPLAALIGKEELAAFEWALARVSDQRRHAFLMRFELGCDFATIAGECGYPSPDAARMAVHRTAETIAREMARAGFEA